MPELGVGVTRSPVSFAINLVRRMIVMEDQKACGINHEIGTGQWWDHTRGVLLWKAARQ